MIQFRLLEERIGLRFKDPTLLREAFTHKTYGKEMDGKSYERLEFLGDSLLNFIVGDYLFTHVKEEEGVLTKMRAALVCEATLKEAANDLELGDFLLMGDELKRDAKFNVHTDDLYESLCGAIYLDRGYDAARDFVEKTLVNGHMTVSEDYKSRLQEEMQKKYRCNVVRYECKEIDSEATGDENRFEATVFVCDEAVAKGCGRNKKGAESQAAKNALRAIDYGEV
ncbi:MAG: ribonuclease III [Peptoniphilus sp.]|nr:ribonuclease III [Peptoniphilus sp.]MDY3119214.1 ribonuclease III [Peptoniphilus sp.]